MKICYVPTGTLGDSKLAVHYCQQESELCVDWLKLTKKADTFWDRLQEAFDQANAPAIAKKLNVEKQTVYKWRKTMPSLETLVAISRSTGRSLHWLITGEGPKTVSGAIASDFKRGSNLSDKDRTMVESLLAALKKSLEE
jgi:hypothetical protein